jgi:hypothetical protein
MKQKTKFRLMLLVAISYLAWTWYISEPTYISGNTDRTIQTYDWVSVPQYGITFGDSTQNQDVETGIVLQTDGETALVKLEPRFLGGSSNLTEIDIKQGTWRLIGTGTIYHKVNQYIGFNLFLISQVLTLALLGLYIYKLFQLSDY